MPEQSEGTNSFSAELKGCDHLEAKASADGSLRLSYVGCTDMLSLLRKNKKEFGTDLRQWPLPEGGNHQDILLRELLLKINGQWAYPYPDVEICHCRLVRTESVDQAIICGAHTPEKVSRLTSASTACGTCRFDVERIIAYRLAK
jgi:bacterioferritin-associated ferredoxin